jgi:hypothetical protein
MEDDSPARAPEETVPVARWLLERMGEITDETLRLLLALALTEHASGEVGIGVDVAELAEISGLNLGRTRLALLALGMQGWVEPLKPEVWRRCRRAPPDED